MQLAVEAAAGPGRARGLDALPARQALLVDRPRRRRRAAEPRRAQSLPRLPLRARRALADRGGEGPQSRRDRARAAGRRPDPAAAVRGAARRPLSRERPDAGRRRKQYALIGVDRAAARRERRQDRPRDGAVRRRPRHPPARRPRARPHGPRRAALDRRRRRARVGALPQRPLRRSARPLEAGAPPRHARRPQALPPRHDRALPRRPRSLARRPLRRALALNPHFSILWAPVARKALR